MKNTEKGITLIALIITIIILVILAAVSIKSVYNIGIVKHAIDGTQQYAEQAKAENEVLEEIVTSLESEIYKIHGIADGVDTTDDSEVLLAAIRGESYNQIWAREIISGAEPLGPSFTENALYYLYNSRVYKATYGSDEKITTVTKTTINPSNLGIKGTVLVTVNGETTNFEIKNSMLTNETVYAVINPNTVQSEESYTEIHYNDKGVVVASMTHVEGFSDSATFGGN